MRPVIFAVAYLVFSSHIVLSDGTILVTGRSSVQSAILQVVAVVPPSPVRALFDEEDLVWNKWDVGNFAVLSLDKGDGRLLCREIPKIKKEVSSSLGFDLSSSGCKVVAVPNGSLLKRLFGLDFSRHENKLDSDGKVVSSAVWINMEEYEQLPHLLIAACMGESAPKAPALVLHGVPHLAKDPDRLRAFLSDAPKIDSEYLFGMSESKWNSMNQEQKLSFDKAAAVCCLFARRELGLARFPVFVTGVSPQAIGFRNFKDFDSTLERYRKNLLEDLSSGKTPDEYLRILDR